MVPKWCLARELSQNALLNSGVPSTIEEVVMYEVDVHLRLDSNMFI